jgi:3-oxoacyl-[acyl-carrier-protein] synthase-3
MSTRARIWALGSCVPDRVVTNAELGLRIDTSDEWIRERTGIRERRWVPEGSGIGASDLGAEAARRALADAGVDGARVGLLIFATLSPDYDFPGCGVLTQRKLGLGPVATLDIRQQCNGFLAGLALADASVRAGAHEFVLVVASEVQSTGLDVSNRGRDMAVIFADGAGAALVGPSQDSRRMLLSTHLHSDGRFAEELWCEYPSSRVAPRLSLDAVAAGQHYPRMNGRLVFRHAVQRMPEAVHEALAFNGMRVADLDLLVPHQANLRILEHVQRTLGLPDDKLCVNIDRLGNTTSASIPLALDEAVRARRIGPGSLVCLTAFGAGFTWGASLLRL